MAIAIHHAVEKPIARVEVRRRVSSSSETVELHEHDPTTTFRMVPAPPVVAHPALAHPRLIQRTARGTRPPPVPSQVPVARTRAQTDPDIEFDSEASTARCR